jgi:hypothetical protein
MAKSDQKTPSESAVAPSQAGTVITPGAAQRAAASPPPAAPAPEPPVPEPTPAPKTAAVVTSGSDEPEVEPTPAESASESVEPGISWTASEFVAHEKTAGWYAILILASLLLAALVYLITKDVISVGVVVIAGILLAVYGSHQPRQVQYSIDDGGINVGQRHYSYDGFKYFSVATEGAFSSLVFMPLKRFAIPLTIYYAPADEERILGVVSNQLPLEEHRLDAVDNLMKHIRF